MLYPSLIAVFRAESIKKALLFGKSDGILAGVPFFEGAFHSLPSHALTSSH